MPLFPPHGRIDCSKCFDADAHWGITRQSADDGWTLENNPCAWGGQDPRFALLGFSKGDRQSTNILNRVHNDIPFSGFRGRINDGLKKLGLLSQDDLIEHHFRSDDSDWAFGSVVRCALEKDSSRSGTIIPQAAVGRSYAKWRDQCTSTFLGQLPTRLQAVIMLSNADSYVEECFRRIKQLHPSMKKLNPISYSNGSVTWIHIVHFGGQGFNWMKDWMEETNNKAGRKGAWAVEAARFVLAKS